MLHGVYFFGHRTTQNAFTILPAPNTPLFQAANSSTCSTVQVTQAYRWHFIVQAPVSGSGWARGTWESKQRKSLFWKFCGQGALPSNRPPYLPHTCLTLDLHLERCSSRSLLALLQLPWQVKFMEPVAELRLESRFPDCHPCALSTVFYFIFKIWNALL